MKETSQEQETYLDPNFTMNNIAYSPSKQVFSEEINVKEKLEEFKNHLKCKDSQQAFTPNITASEKVENVEEKIKIEKKCKTKRSEEFIYR